MRRRPDWRKIGWIALALAAMAAAWRYTPLKEFLTREEIASWAGAVRATRWAPAVLVLAYTPAAILMFPRPVLTLVAVIAFGVWMGVAYATAGIMAAALATYYAGRLLPPDSVRQLAGEKFDPAIKVLKNHGVIAIFALNVMPAPPFAVQGLIAGSTRLNVWHYALGSLLGAAPAMATWAVFGEEIGAALEDPARIRWWLVAVAVALAATVTFLVRRWFARQTAAASAPKARDKSPAPARAPRSTHCWRPPD